MTNNSKRIIALCCLLAILITSFVGCNGSNNGTTTATTSDPFGSVDGSTDDPFAVDGTTTSLFDDFATATTVPSTKDTASTTKKSSGSTAATTAGTTASQVDYKALLGAAGYAYDEKENCFYSTLDPWQRKMGFAPAYDTAAAGASMYYITFRADFDWHGESWRLQLWKGTYGIMKGAEIGVYTKSTDSSSTIYDCADDNHLLNMSMTVYQKNPITDSANYMFKRPTQSHWWLTGFQVGTAVPGDMVCIAVIEMYDSEMADAFEAALKNVEGTYSPNKRFVLGRNDDQYVRDDTTFTIRWRAMGEINYDY